MRRPRRRSPPIQFTIRLYPGPDDDLIGWLDQFGQGRYGAKSLAVKDTLRRGLGSDPSLAIAATPAPSLADIRQVVEAAVTSVLDRLGCANLPEGRLANGAEARTESNEETEGVLEAFGRSLVLGEGGQDDR